MFNNSTYKIDFGAKQDGKDWMVVNDDVMGGRSNSTAKLSANSLIFKGFVSLKNNGGFASLRSPLGKFDLSKYKKVKIRFKSGGRDFALRLGTSDLYYR
ncbi:MAG: CIA30 family protein, partial [Bacteroidia bacterium]|nr:CIA30 family protein [Bacteroidia bacterium]